MLLRLPFFALALALPLGAQPAPGQPGPDTAVAQRTGSMLIARNGEEVLVSWELPDVPIKGVDVYRNTEEKSSGRTRLDFVRAKPALFVDKVPDRQQIYWYWLKVVFTTGESMSVGPVATPGGAVWTP